MYQRDEEGKITTACVDCIFSEKEDKTQIGCAAGRIDKYREIGVNVIESYNGDDEFFVIEDKICSMYRDSRWGEKNYPKAWLTQADKELQGKIADIVIYAVSEFDLQPTLDSVKNQTMAPHMVHLVLHYEVKNIAKYLNNMKKFPFKWRIHTPSLDLSRGEALNPAGDNCEAYYYAVFNSPREIPINLVERLHHRTHHELKPFSYCYSEVPLICDNPDTWNFCDLIEIVQTSAHKLVGGNSGVGNVAFKLTKRALEQKIPHVLVKYEELMEGDNAGGN